MLIAQEVAILTQRVRTTLASGLSVAVVGWRDSNHNQFSRELPGKKVVFFGAKPPCIGDSVGLVLFTRFVDHPVVEKIKRKKQVYPAVIDTGQIKSILESCRDLLSPPPRSLSMDDGLSVIPVEPVGQAPPPEDEMDLAVLDFLTTPRRKEMTDMDTFAAEFLQNAQANGGKAGKMSLAKIIKETCPGMTSAKLARDGWIIPVTKEGRTHVSSYLPSEKLLAVVKQEQHEPDDPYERAKFLIAQKPDLLNEKDRLMSLVSEIHDKLERIETAEKVLAQLNTL